MRIDVVVNATARAHRARPQLAERMRAVSKGRAIVRETSNLEELSRVAEELAHRGTDLVALSGGDGTLMAGISALARTFGAELPAIAFLPAGTVATVARNWGLRGDPVDVLARVLAEPERTRPRETLRLTSKDSAGEQTRIGFIFGTGLVANFFDLYYASPQQGYASAARIVARIFAESFYGGSTARRVLTPLPCTLEVEDATGTSETPMRLAPEAWSLVCASVVRDLGIHMRVTYKAGLDPSRVHLVASPLGPRALGPRAPLVLAGRRIGGPGHFDDLVRAFTVRFPGEGGPFVLDGDILRAREVRVTPGPLLRVVDPA